MEGLTWLERMGWLDDLAQGIPGWELLPVFGLDLMQRISLLESQGVLIHDFINAWEMASRRRFLEDPEFCGDYLSGSVWLLASVKPEWKSHLHDRLVDTFLEPWLDTFYAYFGNPKDRSVHLRWKGGARHCDLGEARHWLRVKGLIPEMNFHHDLADSWRTLDWPEAPPVELMLSGQLREIGVLSRPSWLTLQDCPELVHIHTLEAGGVQIVKAPNLRPGGYWAEKTVVRRFTFDS